MHAPVRLALLAAAMGLCAGCYASVTPGYAYGGSPAFSYGRYAYSSPAYHEYWAPSYPYAREYVGHPAQSRGGGPRYDAAEHRGHETQERAEHQRD